MAAGCSVHGVHAPIQLSFFCGWWGRKGCKKEKYWRINDTAAGTYHWSCYWYYWYWYWYWYWHVPALPIFDAPHLAAGMREPNITLT